MTVLQLSMHALAVLCLTLASVFVWFPRLSRGAGPMLVVGLLLETGSIAVRWSLVGHPPIFGTFENSMAVVWALAITVLVIRRSNAGQAADVTARLVLGWIPVFAIFGAFFNMKPFPLTISERSSWVDVHVAFAWLAFSVLLAASMLAVALLVRLVDESAEVDRALYRGMSIGFLLFTVMVAIGSWYSYLLFLDWFKWEIVETFALATWLGYAASIHAHRFFGWRGRRLAACMVGVLPLMICVFWVWSIYSGTYHHFEIPELIAL